MNDRSTIAGRVRFGVVTVGAVLGLALGACKGSKTVSPGACMNECEQTCPFTPDGQGDNDDYIECLEACQSKCSG